MRSLAFRFLDEIRGNIFSRYVVELERAVVDPAYASTLRNQRLHSLLSLAYESTEYYSSVRSASLDQFPVMTKALMRNKLDAFRSHKYNGRLWKVTSSGSYGSPFTYFHSDTKRVRKQAELLFFNSLAGYEVGTPHVLIRTTPKSRFKSWIQNEKWISPMVIDEEFSERLAGLLQTRWGEIVIGYPSAMAAVAHYWKSLQPARRCRTRAFIATSEAMSDTDRTLISSVFGCAALSRYASEEIGVIGHEYPGRQGHVLNPTGLFVEALRMESDHPVSVGEVGRLVVTDLFSEAYPLIRYDLGDIAEVIALNDDGSVAVIGKVEGKVIESITNTLGKWVSPHSIPVALKDLSGLIQFQFVQTGNGRYEVRCVVGSDYRNEVDLVHRLKRIVGDDAAIAVRYVESIPSLPSGKRPFVLNEWREGRS